MRRLVLSFFLAIFSSSASARAPYRIETDVLSPQGAQLRPSGILNDTLYFGGTTWASDSLRWEAIPDSVWTFDTGVGSFLKAPGRTYPGVNPYKPDGFHGAMEGWYGVDLSYSEIPYFRRLGTSDPRWQGAPCVGAIAGMGGEFSFWAGVLPAEADSLCFVSSAGYGDNWRVCIEHPFIYTGGAATLTFAYRNETELNYDFTVVYVDTNGAGKELEVTSFTGTAAGTSALPLTQGIELPTVVPASIKIKFCFDSDGALSDEDGQYSTACGAFALDDVSLTGGGIDYSTDFETTDDGWVLSPAGPAGGDWSRLMFSGDLPPIPEPPASVCTLTDSVLVMFDPVGLNHSSHQKNVAVSPWIDLERAGAVGFPGHFVELDGYMDLPLLNYLFVLPLVQWYPDTCGANGLITTSPWTSTGFVYYFKGQPICLEASRPQGRIDFTGIIPPEATEVRLAVGVVSYCQYFANCTLVSNTTPWFDNLRFAAHTWSSIQFAIDAASPGDTVWVPPGMYSKPGDVNLTFRGKNLVLKSIAGPEATMIDGRGISRGLVFEQGEDSTSVVEGLTIRNCAAPLDQQGQRMDGGGVYIASGAAPSFRNCIFTECVARFGAGLHIAGDGTPWIVRCSFTGNRAEKSGGGASVGSGRIEDCTFENNLAEEYGGGAYGVSTASPRITRCDFIGNESSGAGAYFAGDVSVTECVFNSNRGRGLVLSATGSVSGSRFTDNSGGGLTFGSYWQFGCNSLVQVEDCEFTGNGGSGITGCRGIVSSCLIASNKDFAGGGISAQGGLYRNCIIKNNAATNHGGGVSICGGILENCLIAGNSSVLGGGIWGGSGSDLNGCGGDLELRGCVITGNLGVWGGGLALEPDASPIRLGGCTVSGNRSEWGGGILIWNKGIAMNHSILWGNDADSSGAELYLASEAAFTFFTCSAIDSFGFGGPGTASYAGPQVFRDPAFCGPALALDAPTAEGDYTLALGSPCLPEESPCDSLIGALGFGCAVVPVLPPPDNEDEPPFLTTPGILAGPNPFTEELAIHYLSPSGTDPRVDIFSVDGRRVASYPVRSGSGKVLWNGKDPSGRRVASGVYLVRFTAGDLNMVRRVVRTR